MKQLIKYIILYLIGGLSYYFIELLWRGFSTWQMAAVGGICFIIIGLINKILSWSTPLWLQSVIATVIVTAIEYISGLILNIWLKLGIWDYSQMPFNLNGQICLLFSLAWLVLSLIAIVVDDLLRYWLFGEDKPKYKLI